MKVSNRVKCLLGLHDWRRSPFVAINECVAGFICGRCRKWRDGEDQRLSKAEQKGGSA
ncbi:hypothetical protein JIX58_07085 [Brevundimonas diminuta]|uniref:hypothetical protein n=1 Tax=Brevundimonas diminuta TaxID=293 RepID=UPI001904DDC6|nr:hypothetical protein [Brevundimonas diminuta]MBK1969418.1 hypothetical protein [Brevundimonas diminuta]MBK1975507.1 hypothetical protein [Brevundimonas diminuta]